MTSKIISLVLCLGVILALALVPGALPKVTSANPANEWGFEIQPNVTGVGFNEDFTVNAVVVQCGDGNSTAWHMRLLFDTTYLEVTAIDTPSTLPTADTPDKELGMPAWDNTTGWAQHGYSRSTSGPEVDVGFVYCTIHFRSKSASGTTNLNFTVVDPAHQTDILDPASTDVLDWTQVVNGTVMIGTPTLTVNVTPTGTGTVKANGVTLTGYPNTTNRSWDDVVTLLAVNSTPGYGFVNWTGDVANPNAISTTVTMDDFTKNVTANFAVAAMPGCNNGSVNVAFVPNPSGPGGGQLPTSNSAFSNFSFTNVPYASVNATTLANYDTVVLIMCDPMNQTTPSQRTDIVNWVSNGGKLIVYDSECLTNATVNNSWLPYPYTTYCPGAVGGNKYGYPWVDLQILEDNTLSSSDPISPYYINTTMIAYDTDAAGDQNVFITRSAGWCGDMMGTNAVNSTYSTPPGTTGYSHGYSHYNKGLFIYNGLDIDVLGSDSDPTANTGEGYLAKIWLLELGQPWDNVTGTTVCGLPCGAPIPPPTPGCVTPTAEFSATPITGLAPLSVQFTDKSTGNVTSWLWDFGDGKTSTAHNPTNTYMKEGKYTVKLTVNGPCGEDTETKVKYINVLSSKPVEPTSLSCSGLYISPQQVKPGQEVTISISVANTGGETGSYNAVLYINGAVEDSQSVSVPGGTSKNVIFTVSKTKAGVYDVSICGQSGQFEVVHTGWFAGGLGTGGIIAIVVVVIVLIVAVIFILRGTARPE